MVNFVGTTSGHAGALNTNKALFLICFFLLRNLDFVFVPLGQTAEH